MAVTAPETSTSKKSKHKKSSRRESVNMSKKKLYSDSKSGSVSDEQDELDQPSFKIPRHSKAVSNLQPPNGDISDSETDIDKPPKVTVVHKSGTQNVNSSRHSQSVVQRSDSDEEEDEDSDDEPQSMSLLQTHVAKISPGRKSNQLSVNSSPKSDTKSLSASGAVKGKVIRRPNVPEMSPSESESDSEVEDQRLNQHHSEPQPSQPQSESESEEEDDEDETPPGTQPQIHPLTTAEQQPESTSEEEEDEEGEESNSHNHNYHHQQQPGTVTALNPSVRIKEEVNYDSEYSSSFEEDDPPPLQEFQGIPPSPFQESSSVSSQRKISPPNSNAVVLTPNMLSDIATFEQEHTRVSAPVIDIPQNSRVWVLQVPRSIEAAHLHGQYFPKKLKGGEVLNLPSGRWQILEQPYEASKSTLNCIVSTGNLCYGMRWFQPRGFWFLKRVRTPIQMDTADAPWKEEVTPLSIKELLKMKSNPASSKVQHMKPSRKRVRDSDPDLTSKRLKVVISEDVNIIHQPFKKRKKKVRLFDGCSVLDIEPSVLELSRSKDESVHKKKKHHLHVGLRTDEQSAMQGGEVEKGKKRKRISEVNEVSPKKKKKKHDTSMVEYDQSHLEVTQPKSLGISTADVHRTMDSATAENISFSKKGNKKNKHKESYDDSINRFSSPDPVVKVKLENTSDDNESRECSSHKLSESSSDKKPKRNKKSHVEQEAMEEDGYMGTVPNDNRETPKKDKKKKKQRTEESVNGETFQVHEKKRGKELASSSHLVVQGSEKPNKKEKKKHSLQNETSMKDTDTDKRKEKKRKHHHNRMEDEVSVQETEDKAVDISVKKKKKHKHKSSDLPKVKQEGFWERETSPDFLSRLYLTQVAPEDQ